MEYRAAVNEHSVRYRLDEYGVQVSMIDDKAQAYFDSFLDQAHDKDDLKPLGQDLAIEIPAESIGAVINPGEIALGDSLSGRRHIWSIGAERYNVWSAGRRLIRDLWLAHVLNDGPVAFIHASVVDDGKHLIAFVGEKYAGKTTLLLDAVFSHAYAPVTNDCLILRLTRTSVMATCVPTYARIRGDTVGRFLSQLRGAIAGNAVAQTEFSTWEALPQRFSPEQPLYIPYSVLSSNPMPVVDLADRELVLVSARITDGEVSIEDGGINGEDAAKILRHNLKNELSRGVTGGMLAAQFPDGAECGRNIEDVLTHVAQRARIIRFGHRGNAEPVLSMIGARQR